MSLSPEEVLSRKETLKQFENYIENTSNILKNFVEKIGWSLDETPTVKDKLVKCPLNSEHRLLPSKLDTHIQTCTLKQNGYDSTHSMYPSYNYSSPLAAQTIQIDEVAQMQILKSAYEESNFTLNVKLEPRKVSQSIERYVCDFTPDERRVLYDSVVKSTKPPIYNEDGNDLMGINLFNKSDEKPKTELEILQEQRDLKRRRAAYRGKRVHTDRKSYVEVLREVVDGLTSSLSHQEDKSASVETSNNISENISNNRIIYKYGGNRNYSGNPYTRWLDIKAEESKLFEYCEMKSDYQEAGISGIQHSKDKTDAKRLRRSKSKSRERRRSYSELKLKRYRRSRSQSNFKETKYIKSKRSRTPSKLKDSFKRHKTQTKSKETSPRKTRSRSISIESKYKISKKHKTGSKSKETRPSKSRSRSISFDRTHKKSKKHKTRSRSKESTSKKPRSRSISFESKHRQLKRPRTRSKSKECSSRKKANYSKSPINYYNTTFSNEIDRNNLKSSKDHKRKKKHKHKKKHSKSPKGSQKSKKNHKIEVGENLDSTNPYVTPSIIHEPPESF